MAESITLTFIQHPAFRAGDRLEVEIDGQVQHDRIRPWSQQRQRIGFGYGTDQQAPFGYGAARPWGTGAWGLGHFGIRLADKRDHDTLSAFTAGDYTIRMRGVDELGNAGGWSTSRTHAHRPQPDAPADLALDGTELTGTLP